MDIIITTNWEYLDKDVYHGNCTDRLSDKWVLDSLRLAKALEKEEFNYVFCSDIGYRRTTTDIIFEQLRDKDFQIIVDQNLREKNAEICPILLWEKKEEWTKDSAEQRQILNRLFIKSDVISYENNWADETDDQVRLRCKTFLIDLFKHYPSDAKIVIVGNPIFNSFLIATFLLRERDQINYLAARCSISRFTFRDWRSKGISFNEIWHLYWA